ncbi:MAG: STT3 domain-containing protein, partial [Candidatus Woesearchaeota archaeon]|nr:STT3 domain-containing protein [Candidatus Woesearchaeota archaeon]
FKEDKEEEKKELKKEIKEVDKELKEDIKEKKEDLKEIKEEEKEIKEIKQDIEDKPSQKELKKAKKDLKELKEDIEEEKDEEDISIDFSKIKGVFKNLGKSLKEKSKEEKAKEDEEEISFDIAKAKTFYTKYNRYIIPILFILIAGFLSVYLRVMPAYLPITDNWAENTVYNSIRSQVRGEINQQYPNLPDTNKNALVEAEFKKILKSQKGPIQQQVDSTSQFFKSHLKNEKGTTYLLAIDPYYWYRYSRNVVEKGTTADIIKEGKPWDNHMLAPLGRGADSNFHIYFEVFLYKISSFFNRDIDLMKVVFYIPVIISLLSVIPTFFIARRMGGNLGGLIAAVMVAIHPTLLGRTAGGFSDTDAYNVFFPLLITWLFLEAFESKNLKNKIFLASLTGFFVGLFSFSWMGWWYIFDFIIASLLFYIIYFTLVHRDQLKKGISHFIFNTPLKNTLLLLIVFIVTSGIFVSMFTGFWNFRTAPMQPLTFTQMKVVGVAKIWPNVLTTVAEQNEASLNNAINQIGIGKRLFFLISLIGIVLMLVRKRNKRRSDLWFISLSSLWYFIILAFKPQDLHTFIPLICVPIIAKILISIKEKDTKIDIKLAIILIIWFIATIYASTKGIRFLLLFVPAFSLAFGIALGIIYEYSYKLISKSLNIHQTITKIALLLLIFFLFILNPINAAKSTAKSEIPSMNDAWYASLDKIRVESESDAIVNSWWDFGHWFKAIADRAVTFDGTTQDMPQAHWIGNTLLTNNETTAIGILRMLDCGATNAFEELDKSINDGAKSVKILYEIIIQDETSAQETLTNKYSLTQEQAAKVIQNTHCDPPENYFITSEDMIGKSGVWGHFGSWNFDRATIYNTLVKKEYKDNKEKGIQFLTERFNYSREEAENIYYDVNSLSSNKAVNDWIAPWPSYASGLSGCSKQDNETLSCSFGQGNVIVNLTTYEAFIPTP